MVGESPSKLPPELWSALKGLRSECTYSRGKRLFQCGEPAKGVYLIESGEVSLLLPLPSGASPIFEKVGPGVALGLSEAMSGENYKLTAQARKPAQVWFVERQELLDFLRRHPQFCMQIVRLLSEDLHLLYHKFRFEKRPGIRQGKRKHSRPS